MPTIKGTASIASNAAEEKLLRSTKFPPSFSQQVDISKVNTSVVTMWVEKEIENILGFEDEIVASMAINLFFPKLKTDDIHAPVIYGKVDPRKAQLDLVGFLGEDEASKFAKSLWEMMIDAQNQPKGIPRVLIEKMKAEIAAKKTNSSNPTKAMGQTFNPLMEEATRRAEMARQAYGQQRQQRQQPQQPKQPHQQRQAWNNHGNNVYVTRPVSPQSSVQQNKDDDSRKISTEEHNKKASKSRSRSRSENRNRKNRHEKRRVQSSDESSLDSYGRRRYRSSSSKRRRDKDYDSYDDERGRKRREHSRRSKRSRSRSRSRERTSRRSTSSRNKNHHRSDKEWSDRKHSRRRDYSRSRSRSSRRDKSRSESSRSSRERG